MAFNFNEEKWADIKMGIKEQAVQVELTNQIIELCIKYCNENMLNPDGQYAVLFSQSALETALQFVSECKPEGFTRLIRRCPYKHNQG